MDVESAKDDLSFEDGKYVVFTDISYIAPGARNFWGKRRKKENEEILRGACGAIRPGRLTYILGPSGAGKTTLLKILAGRKKVGVTGSITGAGMDAVLVNQQALLIDVLTAGETLRFAASLKLPQATERERHHAIESVSSQLGIQDVLGTRASKMSGGERKRLTIACELLTDPTVLLLDEPTSGLDSVSSLSVARALRSLAVAGRTVACVIHQPSSKLFAAGDELVLLSAGKTLHAGLISDIPNALEKAGFTCPQYYNMADFLLEVANNEHEGNLALLENEAKNYAYEMKRIVQSDVADKHKKDLTSETEALINHRTSFSKQYRASTWTQLKTLLWRCSIGAIRDVHLSQIRLVCHVLVALLLGSLFHGAGADGGRTVSNIGCLFFFILFLYFSNAMPTIHTFPVESTVVITEHLNKWYSLPVYCASKIIIDLPLQLLCATAFVYPAWYLTSQPMEPFRIGYAWVVCLLITVLAQTFGLAIGAACGVKLGLFVIPAANIPMLMFSGFFIPYDEMPGYLQPFATISYFRYSFDALMQVVYGFDRPTLPCHKLYCHFKNPTRILEERSLSGNLTLDFSVLIAWIVFLQLSLYIVLVIRVRKSCR